MPTLIKNYAQQVGKIQLAPPAYRQSSSSSAQNAYFTVTLAFIIMNPKIRRILISAVILILGAGVIYEAIQTEKYISLMFIYPAFCLITITWKPNLMNKGNLFLFGGLGVIYCLPFWILSPYVFSDTIGLILMISLSILGLFMIWEGIRIKTGKTT
ncbi:hypothetical protein JYT74_03565 [Crocinitomix catalasitica]|nr:hypothetical protein [Crocinitomix catalasitica]